MPDKFYTIWLKLRWAEKNLNALDFEISAFLRGNPCIALPEIDSKTGEKVWKVTALSFIPQWWSLSVGDIVHDLRSSLDHLIWEVSDPILRQGKERVIQFPICDSEFGKNKRGGFKDRSAQQQISALLSTHQTIVEALQPYKTSTPDLLPYLSLLRDLSDYEKHRQLLLTYFGVGSIVVSPAKTPPGLIDYRRLFSNRVEENTELFRFAKDVEVNPSVTFDIAFDDGWPGRRFPVSQALHGILNHIKSEVMSKFFTTDPFDMPLFML